MTAVPVLTTPRLTLRPRRDADAAALYPVSSDAVVMRWWTRAPLKLLQETRAFLSCDATGDWRAWFITLTGDDCAIGWVWTGEKRSGVSEVGYILLPAVQGQGFAREALTAVIDHLFVEGKHRIFANTDRTMPLPTACWSGSASGERACSAPSGRRTSACATA